MDSHGEGATRDPISGQTTENGEPLQSISGEPRVTSDEPCVVDHRSSAWTEATTAVYPSRDGSAWGFVLRNSQHLHLDSEELRLLDLEEVTARGIVNAEYQRWIAGRFGGVSAPSRPEQGQASNAIGRREHHSLTWRSRKAQRKTDYARLQALYKSPKLCARAIFEGDNGNAEGLTADDMTRYWAEVFGQPSKLDDRTVQSVCETDDSIAQCVTVEEVQASLSGMNDGAPGSDGLKKEDLQKVPLLELTAHEPVVGDWGSPRQGEKNLRTREISAR